MLSPHARTTTTTTTAPPNDVIPDIKPLAENNPCLAPLETDCSDFELIFGEKILSELDLADIETSFPVMISCEDKQSPAVASPWQPPAIKSKNCEIGSNQEGLDQKTPWS
ncbi:Receptor-type tyrosine-protein like [Actinidia chinensis var. chinensis]|uniref:Receptor-type tyrosine-protein like n=1 Tax=Actinidia chinensis var. chinensis TaxID=1590841 RepID=A0A2R6S300_ACTCC|nr:Receptor-type tyrosine-protein like [Actinidia chinensis var. chinensis]